MKKPRELANLTPLEFAQKFILCATHRELFVLPDENFSVVFDLKKRKPFMVPSELIPEVMLSGKCRECQKKSTRMLARWRKKYEKGLP